MGITGTFVQKSDSKAQLYPVKSESHGSGLRNTDLGKAKVVPHTGNVGPGLYHRRVGPHPGGADFPKEPFRGVVQVTQSLGGEHEK